MKNLLEQFALAKIFFRPGIGRRFALWILAFSSVVTLLSTVLQLTIEFNRDVHGVERLLVQVRNSYANSLAGSLWVISKKDVQLQLDGILRLPDMEYLKVVSDTNEVMGTAGKLSEQRILQQETKLYYSHRGTPHYVGKLISVASLEGAYQRLQDKVIVILLSQGIKTFLVSLFILLLFQNLIGRHLNKIAEHSAKLSSTSKTQDLVLDRKQTRYTLTDELSKLVASINSMQQRVVSAYRSLQINDENSRLMIEAIQDYAILRLDEKGKVASWNYGAQRIFGYSSDEIIGQDYRCFFSHADIAENLPEQLLQTARNNVWAENQGMRRCKDGTLFQVESSLTALYTSTAGLSGFTVVTRDITERKRAEEELASSEALLNQSQLLAEVGSWRMYPESGEVIWSAETYHMFGIPEDTTITYEKFMDCVHPDDRDEVNRAWHNSVQGVPYKVQHRIIVNGEIRWVDEEAMFEFDDMGKVQVATGAVKDITERKQFETEQQQLRRAMRLLSDCNLSLVHASTEKQLLENVCRLVVQTGGYLMAWIGVPDDDEDKQVRVIANFGVQVAYLKNAHISWDGEKETGRGPTGTAIRTGKTQINEDVLTNPVMEYWREIAIKNGYRSSIALPLNCHNETLGCLTIYAKDPMAFTDDEVKLLEEMALNIAFGIESFKSDKKRIEAEQATVAKSNFLANMSHEIRTPLNAITGMAQLVRRSGVTAEQDEQLERIDKASEHLLEIINSVLDLSKIEAGKFKLEETTINVSDIVKSVADILFERVSAKNLTLSIEPFTGPLTLLGDATRLKQALLNYAGNALKFTDSGSITIRTLIDDETENNILVRFEVEDTGVGIADDVVERLFHSFEQADNTLTRKYGGTGLGLAITRKIAELMGGDAGVRSTPGAGSIFWFTARLNKIEAVSAENEQSNTKITTENLGTAEQVLQREYPGLRILLADDEPNNRMLVESILETINPVIDMAVNGLDAFQKAEKNNYDIILMDMQMPEMNGLDATRKIRALAGRENIPIIAMTGNAFSEDVTNCLEAGMNDFIAKPFRMNVLFETILKWLVETDK